jgi:NCAIR mutase (PurE)-related protein
VDREAACAQLTAVADGVVGVEQALARLDGYRDLGFARVDVDRADRTGCPEVVYGAGKTAVPTSVGYGAAFGGLAPLLTMLNACAPGVAVMNIGWIPGSGRTRSSRCWPRGRATPGSRRS